MKMKRTSGQRALLLAGLVSVLLCGHGVHGANYTDLDTLTTSLFASYKVDLRPFIDNSTPTSVYMGLWLSSVQELDEIDQSLTVSAKLYMDWVDHRLQWDLATYHHTKNFAYPQKYVWLPDITIANTVNNLEELGFDRNYLYVAYDGTVTWLPGGVYATSCDIDITYYPFDTQTCTIIFTTIVSSYDEIDLLADPEYSAHLDDYSPSGTWDLESFTTVQEANSNKRPRISFQLKLRRKPTYYVIAIILPVIFLSLTATLVFALPADSGEKMGTSITVLLAFAVYLTIVSDQMPKTSLNVSVLSIYLSVLLGQTALGVIMSVWILNLHFRDDEKRTPGHRMRSIAHNMQRLMCKTPWRDRVTPVHAPNSPSSRFSTAPMSTTFNNVNDHGDHHDNVSLHIKEKPSPLPPTPKPPLRQITSSDSFSGPEMMSWKEMAFIFDRFLFYAFSLFLVFSTVIFLIALVAGGQS